MDKQETEKKRLSWFYGILIKVDGSVISYDCAACLEQ